MRGPVSGRAVAALSVFILKFMGAHDLRSLAGLRMSHRHTGREHTFKLITPSRPERLVWAPITSIMLLLAAFAVFIH